MDDARGARRLESQLGGRAGGGLEEGRRVGPPRALLGVREVVEEGGPPRAGQGFGQGEEHGVAAVAAGPVTEDHDGRPAAVEGRARPRAGNLQLLTVGATHLHRRSIPEPPPARAGWYTRAPSAAGPERVRVLVRLSREALQPHAGPQVPLPVTEARGGIRPSRVRPARARRVHPHHRGGGDREDDTRPLLPLQARPGHPHRLRALPRPHRGRAPAHDPRRPPRHAGRPFEEGPRGRPPPLPPRGARGGTQRRPADRRSPGPLGGGARADPAHLQPGDGHREAHPDRADGPVGAARPPGAARAAAAGAEGDRALPPLAAVPRRDRRVRAAPHRGGRGRGQGGLHQRRPHRRAPPLGRRAPDREPHLRPLAAGRLRERLADDHRRNGAPGGEGGGGRAAGPPRSAGTTGSSPPASPSPWPSSPSPWPRGWPRPRRPRPRAPPLRERRRSRPRLPRRRTASASTRS